GSTQDGLPRPRRRDRIGVELGESRLRNGVQNFTDEIAGVNPGKRILVGFGCRLAEQRREGFPRQGVQHLFEPLRAFRMAAGHFVQEAGGMGDERGGHRQWTSRSSIIEGGKSYFKGTSFAFGRTRSKKCTASTLPPPAQTSGV